MIEWIPVTGKRTPKDGQLVLVTLPGIGGHRYMEVIHYAEDLYKVDDYDFHDKKGVPGFYRYDSEWGYCEVRDIIAWAEVEPYMEDLNGMD